MTVHGLEENQRETEFKKTSLQRGLVMNKYILLAMNELEAGNYDAYQVYMKLNKNTRVTKAWQREILTEKDRDSSDDDFRESSESCSQNRRKPEGNYYSIKHWTEEERDYLRKSYQSISDKKMAAVLDRSVEGVKSQRIKLGLKIKTGKPWTEEEHAYLRESYQSISDKKMAAVLDRSVEAVKSQRKKLELKRDTSKPWTEEEHDYLRRNFRKQSLKVMGKALNRSPDQVSNRMHKIGLSKINRYEMYVNDRKVASGTIKEISEQINANLYTVKSWRTNGVSWATFKKCNEN